jgi:hypothetical protein
MLLSLGTESMALGSGWFVASKDDVPSGPEFDGNLSRSLFGLLPRVVPGLDRALRVSNPGTGGVYTAPSCLLP